MAEAKRRSRATPAEVEATIQAIRAYHQIGQEILGLLAQRARFGEGVIRDAAADRNWNETKTRKAVQFARPGEGHNAARLETLFRLLRKYRPIFGTAHLGILITASWSEGRAELQRLCIANNCSKAELEAEVLRRLGPRRHGGRRRAVVADRGHLLVQLGREADSWRPWYAADEQVQHDGGKEVRALDKLPADVRDKILVQSVLTGTAPADALQSLRPAFSQLLADPDWLPAAFRQPMSESYMGGGIATWLLYRAGDGSLSLFSLVVPPGAATPIHDHLAWGLVGLYAGEQDEEVFRRRNAPGDADHAELDLVARNHLRPGDFYVPQPPEGDIHRVITTSAVASVSIHLLGNDTSCVWRHAYSPEDGRVRPFRSDGAMCGVGMRTKGTRDRSCRCHRRRRTRWPTQPAGHSPTGWFSLAALPDTPSGVQSGTAGSLYQFWASLMPLSLQRSRIWLGEPAGCRRINSLSQWRASIPTLPKVIAAS